MYIQTVVVAALAGSAHAGWALGKTASLSAKDSAQAASMTKAYGSKVSEYYASLTTDSDYIKAFSVFREFAQTRTDVPAEATATDGAGVTYTTTPGWFSAMPSEVKNLFEENQKKDSEILKSIQDDANKNDASRPAALGLYASAILVAMALGAAVVL